MTGIDLSAWETMLTDLISALQGVLTTVIPAALAIAAGLLAVTAGVRVIRRLAK